MTFVQPGRKHSISGNHGQIDSVLDRHKAYILGAVEQGDSLRVVRIDLGDIRGLEDTFRLETTHLLKFMRDFVERLLPNDYPDGFSAP